MILEIAIPYSHLWLEMIISSPAVIIFVTMDVQKLICDLPLEDTHKQQTLLDSNEQGSPNR